MKNIIILDNGGITYDRYTIIDKLTGDCLGSSEEPSHPMGFGQYCGNIADNYWNCAYGVSWRRNCDSTKLLNKRIKYAIDLYVNQKVSEGEKIITNVPESVTKFINYYFEKV